MAHLAGSRSGDTLYVEENYHIKGGVRETDHSLIKAEDLDIQESIGDAVDAIIEKVVGKGGKVIFLESGPLTELQKIALVTGSVSPADGRNIDEEVR